ncbi:MAG TPA: protein kinase, partial [Pseudonocardiaceae bacterium]|nr:protein kinase [Pseudonocardiaceae bacterium]
PWPLDQGLRIGGVLADALAHAHDRGVVHRAVQPSNILLDREDLPHLIDFGIAVLAGSPPFAGRNESLPATAYPAPEQWSDDQTGPPADVYALGSALLECLSGRAEQLPAGLPPEVADLLNAMTSTEILDRPTAQACASRLLAAVDDTPAARGVAELGQRRSNAHGGPPSLVVPDLISSRRSETCSITGGRGSVHPPASDLVRARRGPTGMIEDAFGLPPQLVTGHSRLSSSLGSGPSNWVRPATIMPLSRTDGQLRTPLNR